MSEAATWKVRCDEEDYCREASQIQSLRVRPRMRPQSRWTLCGNLKVLERPPLGRQSRVQEVDFDSVATVTAYVDVRRET